MPVCGDGIKDEGEACDDGNYNNGDGCSATCSTERGGGGQSCTVNCGDGDGDTPDELLETGGGEEPETPPVTSRPLVFGPQSPVALQLPAMLAATGATDQEVQRSLVWMLLIVGSLFGLGVLMMSRVLDQE